MAIENVIDALPFVKPLYVIVEYKYGDKHITTLEQYIDIPLNRFVRELIHDMQATISSLHKVHDKKECELFAILSCSVIYNKLLTGRIGADTKAEAEVRISVDLRDKTTYMAIYTKDGSYTIVVDKSGNVTFDTIKVECEVINASQEYDFEVINVIVERISQRIVCIIDGRDVIDMEILRETLESDADRLQHIKPVTGCFVTGKFIPPHEGKEVYFECEARPYRDPSCYVSDQTKEELVSSALKYIYKQESLLNENQIKELVRKFGYEVSKISIYHSS